MDSASSSASTPDKPASAGATGFISNPFGLVAPSWEAIKVNFWSVVATFVIPAGVMLVGVGVIVGLYFVLRNTPAAALVYLLGAAGVIAAIVLAFRMIAMMPLLMLASVHHQKMSFKEAFHQSGKYWARIFGVTLLSGLATIGGFILFIIPGFIFQAWFANAQYIAIEENLGVIDSMKRSKQLVKGRVVEMWGLSALPQVLGLLNLIPILTIVNVAFVLIWLPALAIRYTQLKTLASSATKPPVHWANYVLVVAAIIALPITTVYGTVRKAQQNKPTVPSYNYSTPIDSSGYGQ